MESSKKAVSIRTISILMLLLAGLVSVFSVYKGREVNSCMAIQTEILQEQRQGADLAETFTDQSDHLSEQATFFAATRDAAHLDLYWEMAERSGRRTTAVDTLTQLDLTEEERDLAESVRTASLPLDEGEMWAMRLVADSIGLSADQLPAQIAAVTYRAGEDNLTGEEKWDTALRYLFGKEYADQRQLVRDETDEFQRQLLSRKQGELSSAVAATQAAQRMVIRLDGGLLFLLLCLVAVFFRLILRPFQQYSEAVKQLRFTGSDGLQPEGCREAVQFAETFNHIYAQFLENEQALEKERFRFHIAVESTPVIVYEYDLSTDTYSAFGTLEPKDGDSSLPTERVIPHFLRDHLVKLVEEQSLGLKDQFLTCTSTFSADARVKTYAGSSSFLWSRITATPILDDQGHTIKLIGKIQNIESEKEKELALQDLQVRDSLTGLYTREAGIRLARSYMDRKSPDDICGIFLIDMDDFEQINREEGTAFADAILQETASILREMTGPDDYLIRLGGDEFMVFIKNCPKSRATILGPKIAREIQNLSIDGNADRRISASMGMCVTEVTDVYEELYRCAESTLKFVKQNRRGTAACYLDTSRELGDWLTALYPDRHEIDNIEHTSERQEALILYALDLLEKSKNLDDAIYLLLSRAGRSCGLVRVSIAEVDARYLTCRYLYQWTADPSARQATNIYYIPQEQLQSLIHAYNENGFCEEYSVCLPQKLGSILHTAIWNHGTYEGFMSFETDETGRVWTDEERQLLKELCNVISSFILKAKADETSHAKTEFLSRMSHEIRTPMNAISGMTEIALQMLDDREKVQDCLLKIKNSNSYLLTLINDILDMSRIESGKVELTCEAILLEHQLKQLTDMFSPQFEQKGLKFTVQPQFESGQPILVDFLRLNQVLINLLGNALKFTPTGGEVTLLIEQLEQGPSSRTLRFSVTDTGIGIPEESLDRIFNAFEQASQNTSVTYGGTGLGLSISGKLIQLMGGHLGVNSQVGKGSSFYFTLSFPTVAPEELPLPLEVDASTGDLSDGFAKGMRILLVEDNDLNREIAETILTMHGFQVENAENGKLGVESFVRQPPYYYSAILMDIRMPVMDGLEATRQIRLLEREDSRTIPIIAMTANAFDEDMHKSIESGMNGHLSKPLDLDKLLQMLRSLLAETV